MLRACCAPATARPASPRTRSCRAPRSWHCVCVGAPPDRHLRNLSDPEANLMRKLRDITLLSALGAVALVALSCDRPATPVSPKASGPLFHAGGVPCPVAKMTGGGRIDFPPGEPTKNAPASHDYQTFGAHVISDGFDASGNCIVKGSLEWVDHRDGK